MNTVLIIDDDRELCALMKKCVEQENNFAAVVANGGTDKQCASAHADGKERRGG